MSGMSMAAMNPNQKKKFRKPRKDVRGRYPGGRPKRLPEDDDYCPTMVKRLFDEAGRGIVDAQWGTQLGRLFAYKKLDAAQYGAGMWWAELAKSREDALDAARMRVHAATMERRSPGYEPDPDSAEGRKQIEREEEVLAEFRDARIYLMEAGLGAAMAVRNLCEENQFPDGYQELLLVRRGLNRLVEYRGLTRIKKYAECR